MERNEKEPRDANRDPITGAPGAHPVGVSLGTVAGGGRRCSRRRGWTGWSRGRGSRRRNCGRAGR
jgi:hypothetical protein